MRIVNKQRFYIFCCVVFEIILITTLLSMNISAESYEKPLKEDVWEEMDEETRRNLLLEELRNDELFSPIPTTRERKYENASTEVPVYEEGEKSKIEPIIQEETKATGNEHRFNNEDLYFLAKVIMAEAEGEPYEGKIAVGSVIMNRLESNAFPNTLKKVVYQKKQFSCMWDGRFQRVEPNEECYNAAREVLAGRRNTNALFFENPRTTKSSWMRMNRKLEQVIGNHNFYY